MRARRVRQLAGLAFALLLVGWLLLRAGDEAADERARAPSGAAVGSADRESEPTSAGSRTPPTEAQRARGGAARGSGPDASTFGVADGGARPPAPAAGGGTASEPLDTRRVLPIFLNQLVVEEDRPVVEISGLDPDAPRKLVAWRIVDGRAAILARGESDAAGRLHFPPVVAAGAGLEIVITDADSRPELPGASEVQRLAPRRPEPPQGRVLDAYAGEAVLRIVPTEASGAVLLAGSDGTVFARYPIPPMPAIAARVFDVALELYGDEAQVLMAHEFADGRRSEWRALDVGAPVVLEAAPESEGFED